MAIDPRLIGAGLSLAGGLFGGGSGGGDGGYSGPPVEFRPMDVSGPLGGAAFSGDNINLSLSPALAGLQNQMFGGAALGLQSLSDPTRVAQDYYSRGMELLAPGQAQQRSSLENRLFAQGRLGGTGGAQQYGGLLQAQEQARTGLAQQSLFRGQQARQSDIAQAMSLFGGGMQAGRAPLELASLGLNAGQGRMQADLANMRANIASMQYASPDPLQTALFGAGQAFMGMGPAAGAGAIPPPTPGGGVAPGGQIFTGMHGGSTSGSPWDWY